MDKKIIASALIFLNCVITTSPAFAIDNTGLPANVEDSSSESLLSDQDNQDKALETNANVQDSVENGTETDTSQGESPSQVDVTSQEEGTTIEDNTSLEENPSEGENPSQVESPTPPVALDPVRLSGATRYETARVISEYYKSESVSYVILTTGNGFADALSASVLAHAKEAPILLVDKSLEKSSDAFSYINNHLDLDGTIYIVGGTNIIGNEFEGKLKELGYDSIIRIAGEDRYDTSLQIANHLELDYSSVVISSGQQYPDALSVSSIAANKGWPILLSRPGAVTEELKLFLEDKAPSNIYITGGVSAISDHVQAEIKGILPNTSITRLTGQSRFETNITIAETFASNPSTLYLATGYGFADALAGSVLAAKNGEPMIFISPSMETLPKPVANYFASLNEKSIKPNLVILGGPGIVSEGKVKSSQDLISGNVKGTDIYSIADLAATVDRNDTFSLPAKVTVRLFNSDATVVPIKWNAPANTSQIGDKVYEGIVSGYDKKVKFTLKVRKPIFQYTTYFDPNQVGRTENLRLSAESLDKVQIIPGQTLSFNKTVGMRTEEAGYKEAYIIVDDEYVLGVGGGICQVSSTLYNAVLQANLQIVERHSHSLPVAYVPQGKDATVAYPYLDFKFKNNTPSTFMLHSFIKSNALTIQIQEV